MRQQRLGDGPRASRFGERSGQAHIEWACQVFDPPCEDPHVAQLQVVEGKLDEGDTAATELREAEREVGARDREGDPREARTGTEVNYLHGRCTEQR